MATKVHLIDPTEIDRKLNKMFAHRKSKKEFKQLVKQSFPKDPTNVKVHTYDNLIIEVYHPTFDFEIFINDRPVGIPGEKLPHQWLTQFIGCWNDSSKMHEAVDHLIDQCQLLTPSIPF